MTEKLYPNLKGTDKVFVTCGKCDGDRSISWGANVDGALVRPDGSQMIIPKVCFRCNGQGGRWTLVSSLRAAARREATLAAQAAAQQAAWLAAAPEREAQEAREAAEKAAREAELAAKREAEKEAAEPVPTGRVQITGEIVGYKYAPGYGYNAPDVLKIIVRDDRGFKVFGSCPTAVSDEAYHRFYAALDEDDHPRNYGPQYWAMKTLKGTRVTFTAAVEPSRDDAKFGFYKRPTKASAL